MRKNSNRIVLATGTTGTIGKHLPNIIKALNIDLLTINSASPLSIPKESISLIHLAGIVGEINVRNNIGNSEKINIKGTIELAKKFSKYKNLKFIYVSTSHVYKNSKSKLTEMSETSPISIYANQKLETENALQNIIAPENLLIVRVFSLLDWGMNQNSLGGAAQRLIDKEKNFVVQNTDDIRDFLSPSQVAKTLHEISLDVTMQGIFNLCSSQGITVGNALRVMLSRKNFYCFEDNLVRGNSNVPEIVGDNSKLLKKIPKLNLKWEI